MRSPGEGVEQVAGGLDRVVGQPDGAGEHVGRAAGQRRPARQSVPASPLAASLSVPSPPSTTTTSMPSAAAPWARRVAWPRRLVSASVTSWSADSAFWITTAAARRHRRRRRVDEQQDLHGGSDGTSRAPSRFGRRPAVRATECRAMNVVVCVKQIPDPAEPGQARSLTTRSTAAGSSSSTSPTATASRWPSSWSTRPAAARSPSCRWPPTTRRAGCAPRSPWAPPRPSWSATTPSSGAGALDTAKVLAAAIKRAEPDLVLAATESSDGYTGTVPEQIAALLGLPSVTFAKDDRDRRRHGRRSSARPRPATTRSSCPLPAVVSVTAGVVEPRYPSLQGDHGRQVQAGRRGDGRRPRPRRRPGRLGRRRPGDRRRRRRRRPARPARSSRTTARPTSKIVAFLDNLKVI